MSVWEFRGNPDRPSRFSEGNDRGRGRAILEPLGALGASRALLGRGGTSQGVPLNPPRQAAGGRGTEVRVRDPAFCQIKGPTGDENNLNIGLRMYLQKRYFIKPLTCIARRT